MTCREKYNFGAGVGATIIAIGGAICGISFRNGWGQSTLSDDIGGILVASFAVGAPVAIWLDWVWFCRNITDDKILEGIAHTHELERNIWLAVTAVLIALFKLKWPGS